MYGEDHRQHREVMRSMAGAVWLIARSVTGAVWLVARNSAGVWLVVRAWEGQLG